MLTDHLGSPIVMQDSTGAMAWQENLLPFGEKWTRAAANDNDRSFTGHIEDTATGLTYMPARYYNPVVGRFLRNDPATFHGVGYDPAYFNRYAYVENDPTNLTDTTGMCPWCIGAIIGAVAEVVIITVEIKSGGDVGVLEGFARVGISAGAGAAGVGIGAKVGQAVKLGGLSTKTLSASNNVIKIGNAIEGGVRGAVSGASVGAISEYVGAEGKQAIGVGNGASAESMKGAALLGAVTGGATGVYSGSAKGAAAAGDVSEQAAKVVSTQAATVAETAGVIQGAAGAAKRCAEEVC